jgi:hypothetical protein
VSLPFSLPSLQFQHALVWSLTEHTQAHCIYNRRWLMVRRDFESRCPAPSGVSFAVLWAPDLLVCIQDCLGCSVACCIHNRHQLMVCGDLESRCPALLAVFYNFIEIGPNHNPHCSHVVLFRLEADRYNVLYIYIHHMNHCPVGLVEYTAIATWRTVTLILHKCQKNNSFKNTIMTTNGETDC